MIKLTAQLNDILSQWAEVFDLLSQIRLVFTVDSQAYLYLNDIQLCSAKQMVLDHVMYGPEQITFYFENSNELGITIAWPEDGAPFVSDINFTAASDAANK